MDDIKIWTTALISVCTIALCMVSCENKSNKNTKPVYTEWEPTSTPTTSYTPSSSTYQSYTNPSSSSNSSTGSTGTGYTYSYSYSSSLGNNSSSNDSYENWETEDIEGFYVKLEGCETDEQAEYISDNYYSGEYIEEGWDYYAKTTVKSGIYEVELGDKVNSKFFKIRGSDYYIRFKWSTSLWKWDEGVMDVWNSRGTFYIKPD